MSATLSRLLQVLGQLAPLELAADWDNVGLLIESGCPDAVDRLMLTVDLSEAVLEEVLTERATFVVAYHPVIFKGITRITQQSARERVLATLLRRGVSVYSPHTALDAVTGGINDWLANALGEGTREPIELPPSDLARRFPGAGLGRWVALREPAPLAALLDGIKAHLGLSHLRVAATKAHADGDPLRLGAVCAGAGGGILSGLTKGDLLLTGEMRHHDVCDAVARGQTVVLTEHSNSERGYLVPFAAELSARLDGEVEVLVSRRDSDPLTVT